MKKFTVFTPTYNRMDMLPKLYESLLKQTGGDFVWLVVDDGSTDCTEALIQGYILEKRIEIQYLKQNNQGKHIAINTALEKIRTPYFITIDSDDYITGNCIEVCQSVSLQIDDKEEYAGFSFIHFSEDTDYQPENYGKRTWTVHNSYQWEYAGEMVFCFKTEKVKQFKFPVFKNEKFCQEAYWLIRIFNRYTILYTDHVLAHGEYLEDGLTKNLGKKLSESPQYTLATLLTKYKSSFYTRKEKRMLAISYIDYSIKSNRISWSTLLTEIGIANLIRYLKRKFIKKTQ